MDITTETTAVHHLPESKGSNDVEPVMKGDEDDNPEEEMVDDDDDDDDDDDMLHIDMDVPLMEDGDSIPVTIRPQAPSKDCRWNDNAILECFQLALESHDENLEIAATDDVQRSSVWNPPPLAMDAQGNPLSDEEVEFLTTWKPKSLAMPAWATNLLPRQ